MSNLCDSWYTLPRSEKTRSLRRPDREEDVLQVRRRRTCSRPGSAPNSSTKTSLLSCQRQRRPPPGSPRRLCSPPIWKRSKIGIPSRRRRRPAALHVDGEIGPPRPPKREVFRRPEQRLDEVVGASDAGARELDGRSSGTPGWGRTGSLRLSQRYPGVKDEVVPVVSVNLSGGGRLARRRLRAAHREVRRHVLVLVEDRRSCRRAPMPLPKNEASALCASRRCSGS